MKNITITLTPNELLHLITIMEMNEFNDTESNSDDHNKFLSKLSIKMIKKFRTSGYDHQNCRLLEYRLKDINTKNGDRS